MSIQRTRRQFVRDLGVAGVLAPFLHGLPSLAGEPSAPRRQRLVFLFSPNGTVPAQFWPDTPGESFQLKKILEPLEPFRDRLLVLQGVSNRVRGDGDNHMRGMSCLLTGIELFPGNIQGGSHTPAGWASGISIDQEIKNFLQSRPETRTRFGSLEFGVLVPERADPWTRWVYGGPNKPLAPISDPYQMFAKLYGRVQDQDVLRSVLDGVQDDLRQIAAKVSAEDRQLLEEHLSFVREMEQELQTDGSLRADLQPPALEPGVKSENDNLPKLSRLQIELLVNSLRHDMARVATLQMTNSVGQPRMRWLGVDESHHELSHEPDSNAAAQEKLIKINRWHCEQLALLAQRLQETPEPGGPGNMLDHTLLVWTNELGKGNSHTLDNIPFVLVGNGADFRMGRALKYPNLPHNRLHLALAHALGHHLETFGKPELCSGGVLPDLT